MLRCRDGKLHSVWSCERRLGLQREKDRRERERESVLLCCLVENWTEEGELQCGCPHRCNIIEVKY